jgi:pSer/pThr/pTyr-binding forkhead associated (FHA) protein
MSVLLRCTKGPIAGEVLEIEAELVFGRVEPEPGHLGEDPRLSRRHARVFIDDAGSAIVEDLGSTNGTWVNDERLEEPRFLHHGDELRVGQTCFTVELPKGRAATQLDSAIAAPTLSDGPPATPCLRVAAGPSQGLEIALGDELPIGRGYPEPGDLGGDRLLSRRHARIARGQGGVFFIEDTGSTNGTVVNGQRVRGSQSLKDGDEIKVGLSTLVAVHLPGAPLTPELEEEPAAERVPSGRRPLAQTGSGAFEPQGEAGARLSSRRATTVFVAVFAAAAIIATGTVFLAAPLGTRACPQGFICHKPPTAPALRALTTFTGSLGWRDEYDPQLAAPSKADITGNQLVLHETPGGDQLLGAAQGSNSLGIWIRGYQASQISPQAAMQSMIDTLDSGLVGATTAPSSDQTFDIPVLGFHRATGQVLEGDARTPQGPGPLVKVAVLAASAGAVTVVAAVVYEVRRGTTQNTNPDEQFDRFADQVLETIRFPSDGSV